MPKEYYAPMHTAEHILNQTMVRLFGCQRSENCHVEKKKSKCDFVLDRQPTEEEIKAVEDKVNQIIKQDLEVGDFVLSYDEAAEKYKIRVAKEENPTIRIVHVGDYDYCPCAGNHVERTSEIGEFKIISYQYENNILRIRFKVFPPEEAKLKYA